LHFVPTVKKRRALRDVISPETCFHIRVEDAIFLFFGDNCMDRITCGQSTEFQRQIWRYIYIYMCVFTKRFFKVLKTLWIRRVTDTCSGTARAPDVSSFWRSAAQCMDSHGEIICGICGNCTLLFSCQRRLLELVGTASQELNLHLSLVCNVLG